jgi:acetoin utilization protein AcuC
MAGAPPARFIGSEVYRATSYGGRHPLRVPRVSTVIDLCRALGWFGPGAYLASPRAKAAALAVWHDPAYVAALEAAEATQAVSPEVTARHGLGSVANPVFPGMFRRPATSAGGAMLAAELVAREGGAVHVPGGGTHHGLPDRANGFCYLNDPVLCLLRLRALGLRRLAYVDIDAHHPDGVELAFGRDSDCLMISVHEEGRWPFTGRIEDAGAGNVFNLPVPRGLNDTGMRAILEGLILPRIDAFAPEAVVLQCGADAVLEDPLSRLSLSNNAHWAVVAALKALAPRMVVLGGGGYNPWTVARLWAGVWAVLAGREVPDRLPPAAAAVLRGLPAGAFAWRVPPAPHLLTTLRDPPREGPVPEALRDRLARLAARR